MHTVMFDSRGLIFWSSEIGVGWGRASTAQSVLSDHIALSRASLSHLLNSMVLYNDCVLMVSSRLLVSDKSVVLVVCPTTRPGRLV